MMAHLRDNMLIGMGNPLLDISAHVDNDLLDQYGLEPNGAILATEKHLGIYDHLDKEYEPNYIPGGSVKNSLRVATWILQRHNTCVFFGAVGTDRNAEILEEQSIKDGVKVCYQHHKNVSTGRCAVLITDLNRSLCAELGAANCFSIDHLDVPENKELIQKADYFYISGFFVTVSPDSIMKIAEFSYLNNRTFMMNLSASYVPEKYGDQLIKIVPYIDIIFGNEMEAISFAKLYDWDTEDLKDIGMKMVQLPMKDEKRTRLVILTQGPNPVYIFHNKELIEMPVEPLPEEKIIDTNGAGDAFVGGFLAQLLQKCDYNECVECGIWAAREIIQRPGVTFDDLF